MKRIAAALLALVLAACAGGTASTSTTSTTSTTAVATTVTTVPGLVVTSDDGRVTLEAALEADPGITITALADDALPDSLAALAGAGAAAYALSPAGFVFDTPAIVAVTLPADAALSPSGIPVIAMVITDGTTVEFADDLEVTREGDTVTVRGAIGHFSALAVVSTQVVVEARIVEATDAFVSELGVDFTIRPALTTPAGEATLPGTIVPSGSSPLLDFNPSGSDLIMRCREVGTGTATMAWDTVFGPDLAEIARIAPIPAGGVGVRLVLQPTVRCLGPEDIVLGFEFDYEDVVDHPGGETIVPGEDFLGGRSGLAGSITGIGLPPLALGLICDLDQDGVVDSTDWMYPPFPTAGTPDMARFVLPLPGMAHYFVYGLRPGDFESLDGLDPQGASVLTQLPLLAGLFRGNGRIESSVGVVGIDGIPFIRRVFAAEDRAAAKAKLVVFVTPRLIIQEEE